MNRVVVPARQAAYRLAESIPWNDSWAPEKCKNTRAGIFERVWGPGIDSKE
jgi:hypothetical protein